MLASISTQTNDPDGLIAGPAPLHSRQVTLLAGQNLTRGAVIGKISIGGKYKLSASAAGDGSETPDLVLAEDCDASAADTPALAYDRGDFAQDKLTLGAGHTVDSIREGLRDKGITLIATQGA